MSGRVLLLDLDGTVCVGDGPALRYAAEVGALLTAPARGDLHAAVADFLAGSPTRGNRPTPAQDAYQLVQAHAAAHGLRRSRSRAPTSPAGTRCSPARSR